jgi:hypothetical protein
MNEQYGAGAIIVNLDKSVTIIEPTAEQKAEMLAATNKVNLETTQE